MFLKEHLFYVFSMDISGEPGKLNQENELCRMRNVLRVKIAFSSEIARSSRERQKK